MRAVDWWRLGLAACVADEERATDALGDEGLDGLEIVSHVDGEGSGPPAGTVWIRVYVEPSERAKVETMLAAIAGALPNAHVLEPAPISRDAWAGWFEPVTIGAIALVAAGDDGARPSAAHVVQLHPGMGFGAGEHPSTRLALAVLQRAHVTGATVIDVGSGTGVLAIAALHLGAARATAVDIAADARRATAENAALNEVTVEVLAAPPEGEVYDLVVANILAPVLLELRPVLDRLAGRAGQVILSGVRADDLARVVAAYAGWTIADREDEDGWVSVRLERAVSSTL